MYNIFQPILSVDQAMNAEIDTYEMLIRNNNGEFPGINFLHSLTTQEGNDAWIKASRKSLKNALNEQQNRKIYINLGSMIFGKDKMISYLYRFLLLVVPLI